MARKESKSSVVVGNVPRWRFNRKVTVLVSCVILLVVAAALLIGLDLHYKNQVAQRRQALVTEAVPILNDRASLTKLAPIITEIKQQPGYDHDVDCLYVLTMYYIQNSESANAKVYYDKLAENYNAKEGYSNPALKNAQTPSQLKSLVEFTAILKQEAQQNVFYAPSGKP
jgi:hypothetical protein